MRRYFVHTLIDNRGDHEVHVESCFKMPSPANAKYLGVFSNCHDAVREAKKTYRQVNGCIHCCTPCHTQ